MLDRLGLALVAAGSVLSLLGVFAPMPIFPSLGIWYQSEPIVDCLFVFSAVAAAGLGLLAWSRPWVRHLLVHPVFLLAGGVAAWSAFAGLFQSLPLAGWYGSPEVGEGTFWYLEMAVLAAAAMVLARVSRLRIPLAALVGAVVAILTALTWYHEKVAHIEFVPLFFPDYLGFLGLFLVVILAASLRLSHRSWWLIPLLAGGILVIIVSTNYAAIGMILVPGPVILLAATRILGTGNRARRWLTVLGLAVPLLISVTVLLPFLPNLSTERSLTAKLANSALSRQRLLDVIASAAESDPAMIVRGYGWGRYSDLLAIHLPVEWAILDDSLKNREVGPTHFWDAVHRVDFHSHNYLGDAFIGGGMPAAILVLLLTATAPVWARRRHLHLAGLFAVVLGGVSAYWFQMPVTMPYQAFALGLLAAPWRWSRLRPALRLAPTRAAPALFFGMATLLLVTGIQSFAFSSRAFNFMPSMAEPLGTDVASRKCPKEFNDGGRDGQHLLHRLRTVSSAVVSGLKQHQDVAEPVARGLAGLICVAEDHVERGASFRLLVSTLLARSDLAFAPPNPLITPIAEDFLANWGQRLNQALHVAPHRTDLAATYLLWLLNRNKVDEFRAWTDRLYARTPDDMVALWFSGIALLDDPAQTLAAVERMRRALKLGIERIIPVEDELKRELGQ